MIDILKGEINFLKSAWDLLGRPLVTLVLKKIHLGLFFLKIDFCLFFVITTVLNLNICLHLYEKQ